MAVVLAMAMVMGSSITALALQGNGSEGSPYLISTMKTGNSLSVYPDGNHKIYVKNDTGRTLYVYVKNVNNDNVCFTDKPTYYDDFQLKFPNADDFKLDSGATIFWSLPDYATVTIRMSAPVPPDNTPEHVHSFTWQTISEPTQYADGLEGEVCTICGETRNTKSISAYGYTLNGYAVSMINAAKAGQTVTFEFGEWNSFPKSFMEKIAAKSKEGVTFVFHYNWKHVKQEITIPAGTPIDLNFDWYGPAKMAELYGAN